MDCSSNPDARQSKYKIREYLSRKEARTHADTQHADTQHADTQHARTHAHTQHAHFQIPCTKHTSTTTHASITQRTQHSRMEDTCTHTATTTTHHNSHPPACVCPTQGYRRLSTISDDRMVVGSTHLPALRHAVVVPHHGHLRQPHRLRVRVFLSARERVVLF